MSLILKWIFQGVKNVKNCIFTLNFTISGQLGRLITSRQAFRLSWNFQKLMQVRYTPDLRAFQFVKISFFPRSGGSLNCKKKPMWNVFSIFDIKYFFRTPYTFLKSEFKDIQKQFTENLWTWKHSFMLLPTEICLQLQTVWSSLET